jgi:hypothetical protein
MSTTEPARTIIIRAWLQDVQSHYADSGIAQQLHVAFRMEDDSDLTDGELAAIHEAVKCVYQTSDSLGGRCDWRTPGLVHFGTINADCLESVPHAILEQLERLITVAGLDFTAELESTSVAA